MGGCGREFRVDFLLTFPPKTDLVFGGKVWNKHTLIRLFSLNSGALETVDQKTVRLATNVFNYLI